MTDYSAVTAELKILSALDDKELEQYKILVENICSSVSAQLKSDSDENDSRVIHLAACKSYYQILLLNQSENLTSFKAGDITYSMSSATVDCAKVLYEQALGDCLELFKEEPKSDAFAFKAV